MTKFHQNWAKNANFSLIAYFRANSQKLRISLRWYISWRNLMLEKIWVHLILNLWQPIYYFLSLYGSSRPFDKDFGLYHVALILSDLLLLYHSLSCYTTLQFTKTFFKKATAISFQFWSIFPRHQVPLLNVLPQRANFMMLLLELRQRNFYVASISLK